jgi:hypothetical protein
MWMQEIRNREVPGVPGVTLKITSFILFNFKYSKLFFNFRHSRHSKL